MSEIPITTLLESIHNGDEDALITLHAQYSRMVYSVAYKVLSNEQDAEEVSQDVFLQLWDQAQHFDPEKGTFTTWLLTIARRTAIDKIRKRERRTPPENSVSIDSEPHLWETLLGEHDLTDRQRTLLATLHELPKEQQNAIYLAYFQGMSHGDISAYLKKPLGTVKSYIRLGMKKLRDIWLKQSTVSE